MSNRKNRRKIVCESTNEIVYTYKEYLKTTHWANIKLSIKDAVCCICGSSKIQLHHQNYDNLGKEIPEDIVALCGKHHMEIHGISPKKRRKTVSKYKIKRENGVIVKVYPIKLMKKKGRKRR